MISTPTVLFQIAVVALAASAPGVDAHGVLSKPGPAFAGTAYAGGYSAAIPMKAMPAVAPDVYGPSNSWAEVFGRAFKKSSYKSLREFMIKNQDMSQGVKSGNPSTAECGFTVPDKQTAQALPDNIEWYGGQQNHPGPCEAWCDNELVLPFTDNCQQAFPKGVMKYDKDKCVGKNRLSFYWMATLNQWQVYIDCVKIGNGAAVPFNGGSGGSRGTTTNTTAAVPVSTTKVPAAAAPAATTKPVVKCNVKK